MKGGIGLRQKISDLIATNLTSICCDYKEKIENDSYRSVCIQNPKFAILNSDRKQINLISNKSFRY